MFVMFCAGNSDTGVDTSDQLKSCCYDFLLFLFWWKFGMRSIDD